MSATSVSNSSRDRAVSPDESGHRVEGPHRCREGDALVDVAVGESKVGVPECDELIEAINAEMDNPDDGVIAKAFKRTILNRVKDSIRDSLASNTAKDREEMIKTCRDFKAEFDKFADEYRALHARNIRLSGEGPEYFAEHIFVTFQDDWTAFSHANDMNWRRLMWANDFPHSDSTWPWSQEMLAEQTAQLTAEQTRAILSGNVADLYGIDVTALQPTAG